MSYIGRQLNNLSDRVKLDSITASATATYNLLLNGVAYVPSSAESLTVSLNGVIQAPQDSYTVSGSTITFASTLSASDSIDFILAERSITFQTPSSGSVGITELAVSDGTNGQALTTNGSGTLSFSTVSADADNYFATSGLSSKDLGVGLHIKLSDTGASVSTGADALVIEDNGGDMGMSILSSTSGEGKIAFGDSGGNSQGQINYAHSNDSMRFYTGASERMRIHSDGDISIGTTSNEAKLDIRDSQQSQQGLGVRMSNGSYDSYTISAEGSRDTSGGYYYNYQGRNGGGQTFRVQDGGNVQNSSNSYGAISDERIKQNIEDASSQWEDIKALKIRKFKLKKLVNRDGADETPYHLGVIAQELESSGMSKLIEEDRPEKEDVALHSDFGSIDEEGNFTAGQNKKGVKYSVLYMKSIKALQEAMDRIETLEARVQALENA